MDNSGYESSADSARCHGARCHSVADFYLDSSPSCYGDGVWPQEQFAVQLDYEADGSTQIVNSAPCPSSILLCGATAANEPPPPPPPPPLAPAPLMEEHWI